VIDVPIYRKKHDEKAHENHLCKIAESGVSHINEYRQYVDNAKYMCTICGRAANKEENLCDPWPIAKPYAWD